NSARCSKLKAWTLRGRLGPMRRKSQLSQKQTPSCERSATNQDASESLPTLDWKSKALLPKLARDALRTWLREAPLQSIFITAEPILAGGPGAVLLTFKTLPEGLTFDAGSRPLTISLSLRRISHKASADF